MKPVLAVSNVVNGKICPGTDATVTASSLNGYSYVWYESTLNNSSNKTLINPNGATTASHTTSTEKTYYVQYVDQYGCLGPEESANVDYLENLSTPQPVINDYAVCNADELILTVSNKEPGVTYTWTAVDGVTGGAVSSGYNQPSEYYYGYYISNPVVRAASDAVIYPAADDVAGHTNSKSILYTVEASRSGCSISVTMSQPIIVNGTPVDQPEITSASGTSPIEICPNTTEGLSLVSTVTGLTYEWEKKIVYSNRVDFCIE